jgi:competence protein ComEA
MKTGRLFNGWAVAVTLLVLVVIAGGSIILIKSCGSPGIEISLAAEKEIEGQVYVSGEVNNPGLYPIYAGDSLEDIIRAAGGVKDGADLRMIKLSVDPVDDGQTAQKVNINLAEAWLLEALPGVGEAKAQAIIDYRQQNGPFRDVNELLKVPGFGDVNYAEVKGFITVYD